MKQYKLSVRLLAAALCLLLIPACSLALRAEGYDGDTNETLTFHGLHAFIAPYYQRLYYMAYEDELTAYTVEDTVVELNFIFREVEPPADDADWAGVCRKQLEAFAAEHDAVVFSGPYDWYLDSLGGCTMRCVAEAMDGVNNDRWDAAAFYLPAEQGVVLITLYSCSSDNCQWDYLTDFGSMLNELTYEAPQHEEYDDFEEFEEEEEAEEEPAEEPEDEPVGKDPEAEKEQSKQSTGKGGSLISSLPTPTPVPPREPMNVKNGQIFIKPAFEQVCPFTVSAGNDMDYYIYLEYIGRPESTTVKRSLKSNASSPYESDIAFYVKAGQTVEVEVPIGVYRLYYAAGYEFYGTSDLFLSSEMYTSEELLDFYADKKYYQGHSITLYAVENGNFDTDPVDPANFPRR